MYCDCECDVIGRLMEICNDIFTNVGLYLRSQVDNAVALRVLLRPTECAKNPALLRNAISRVIFGLRRN